MLNSFMIALGTMCVLLLITAQSEGGVVYQNNFTSGTAGSEWSPNTVTLAPNGTTYYLGEFSAQTATLTLPGLAAHNSVTVSLTLDILKSWDGNGPAGGNSFANPDSWSFTANGTSIFLATFANYNGGSGNTQSFGGPNGTGGYITTGAFPVKTGANTNGTLGYGTGDFGDAEYNLAFTFPSSSPTLALAFADTLNEGLGNESWALNNVVVSTSGVPEPTSIGAVLTAGLCLASRRRRAFA